MSANKAHDYSFRIWIEHKGEPILGKGGADILEQIEREQSISKTAARLHMSYRYVWSYLQRINTTLGKPAIQTFKGGKSGGGGARLTPTGKDLLTEYKRIADTLDTALAETEHTKSVRLATNLRNRLKGKIVAAEKESDAVKIRIEIVSPVALTALISRENFDRLETITGDQMNIVINASSIRIEK